MCIAPEMVAEKKYGSSLKIAIRRPEMQIKAGDKRFPDWQFEYIFYISNSGIDHILITLLKNQSDGDTSPGISLPRT
jgi:hypothetical protein